jgi:hypothetical protein
MCAKLCNGYDNGWWIFNGDINQQYLSTIMGWLIVELGGDWDQDTMTKGVCVYGDTIIYIYIMKNRRPPVDWKFDSLHMIYCSV